MTIREINFRESITREGSGPYEGYEILTDNLNYYVVIDSSQSCCESWGTVISEDAPKDFIGAELRKVEVVDKALEKIEVPEVYEGGVMFVNIVTNRGVFQIALYNDHNGYYGHEAVVWSEKSNGESTTLYNAVL